MATVMTLQDNLRFRRRKICVFVILLIVVYLSSFKWDQTESVWCFYSTLGDALPPTVHISSSNNSIFFHETSCEGNLTSRQACAIESAARAHLDYQIRVLFNAPLTEATLSGNPFTVFRIFKNVQFARIHMNEYAKGTPMERVVRGALNGSLWWITHASDVMRYLTLYKWGGVYLDLDVVVVKRFDALARNWAARESKTHVAVGALAFSGDAVGRKVAMAAAR